MICFESSGLFIESATDGDEYAFEATQVQCITKVEKLMKALKSTTRRVSRPNMPRFLSLRGSKLANLVERSPCAGTVEAFFAFFFFAGVACDVEEVVGSAGLAVLSGALASVATSSSGSVRSMYLSSNVNKATAALTQSQSVRESMRRTIAPAK